MAFPANASDIEVCVAYGANLASDLTTLTYSPNLSTTLVQPRLPITRGRIGGAARTQPTTIDLGLKNPGGVFSPRNIVGPHYGQLRRNTPVRVRVDPGTGMVTRAIAYMPDWPTRWTGPDIDDRIPMQASGALRRLGVGQEVKSALKRSILAAAPLAYWPLEDGSAATYGAAAAGISNMLTPGVVFAAQTDLVGSLPTPTVTSATVRGEIVGVSATGWYVQFAVKTQQSVRLAATIRCASATYAEFQVFTPSAASPEVQGGVNNGTGAALLAPLHGTTVDPVAWTASWHQIAITAQQVGGNVVVKLWVDGVAQATNTSAGTLSAPVLFLGNPDSVSFMTSLGHVAAGNGVTPVGAAAMTGYPGELAGSRFVRLCTEDGIAYELGAGTGQQMGPQLPGNIVDLLHECEDSDEGVIIERRTGVLGFDPPRSRYNKTAALTVNYLTQVADLLPEDDDRDLRNYITVGRIGGSSGTVQRTAGPLGTDKTTGVDRYPDQISRSLATDPQAVHHAGWLTNVGTVDEPRYVVGINLSAHPELVTQWLACDIGSRILINNPPAIQVGPAPLDLIIEGYQELIDGVEWYVTLYALPYRPYEVYQIETGTGNRSRIAAGVSTTDLVYSASATSLSVTSASVRWIDSATYPSKFPIVIEIAGEAMTCTAIVGTGLTQTFTVTRGLHGVSKALPITSTVQIWRAPCIAL